MDKYELIEKAKLEIDMDESEASFFTRFYLALRNSADIKTSAKITMSELKRYNTDVVEKREVNFAHMFVPPKASGKVLDSIDMKRIKDGLKDICSGFESKPKSVLANLIWVEALSKNPSSNYEFKDMVEAVTKLMFKGGGDSGNTNSETQGFPLSSS
jgi:hypothetical protein